MIKSNYIIESYLNNYYDDGLFKLIDKSNDFSGSSHKFARNETMSGNWTVQMGTRGSNIDTKLRDPIIINYK